MPAKLEPTGYQTLVGTKGIDAADVIIKKRIYFSRGLYEDTFQTTHTYPVF
jgi:hypothetical protein